MKRFCGRDFSGQEMRRLGELIGEDPTRSRAQLSRLACQLLGWFKPDRRPQGDELPGGHAAHAP